MLVAEEVEELVLDERAGERAARNIAMQFGILIRCRDAGVVLEEEGRGVDPVGAAVSVDAAMDGIAARAGAHVDVRAAG